MEYHYCSKCEEVREESQFLKLMLTKRVKTCNPCLNERRRELYYKNLHRSRLNNRKRAKRYLDKKKSLRLANK